MLTLKSLNFAEYFDRANIVGTWRAVSDGFDKITEKYKANAMKINKRAY